MFASMTLRSVVILALRNHNWQWKLSLKQLFLQHSQRRTYTMTIERYKSRVALVTGASSGIGAGIVLELVKQGLIVVGMARRVEKIQALDVKGGPGKLHAIKGDITKEEDILKTFKWINDNLGGVDVLVNNAGVTGESELTDADTSEWRRIFEVNVIGLSICTREAVKGMRERGVNDGYIIHISSMVAHHPVFASHIAMYTASKYAVKALTEGLRKDLVASGTNIRNTTISPGLVKSEIIDGFKKMDPKIVWNLPHMLPEDIAKAVTFVLSQPLRVQIQDILINEANSNYALLPN